MERCLKLWVILNVSLSILGGTTAIVRSDDTKQVFESTISAGSYFLFAHGIHGNKTDAEWYINTKNPDYPLITAPCLSFNFPILEQDVDRAVILEAAYKKLVNLIDTSPADHTMHNGIAIFGSSQGAATAINAVATSKFPYLKALIAEAPFIHEHSQRSLSLFYEFLPLFMQSWIQKAGIYYPDNRNILANISRFPHDIPILLVHAKNDECVPLRSTQALYLKLIQAGHPKAYLLELEDGKHGKYTNVEPDCAQVRKDSARKYLTVVHAIYRAHDIPYNKQLADEGEQYLASGQLQPDAQKIEQLMYEEMTEWSETQTAIAIYTTLAALMFAYYKLLEVSGELTPPEVVTVPTTSFDVAQLIESLVRDKKPDGVCEFIEVIITTLGPIIKNLPEQHVKACIETLNSLIKQ